MKIIYHFYLTIKVRNEMIPSNLPNPNQQYRAVDNKPTQENASPQIEVKPSFKKQKTLLNPGKEFSYIEELAGNVAFEIIRRLSFKSFIAFEQASHRTMELCRPRWNVFLTVHKLEFEWPECSDTLYPERRKFILGKLVHAYAMARLVPNPDDEQTKVRFGGMMQFYTRFGAFVNSDLNGDVEFHDGFFIEQIDSTRGRIGKGGYLLLRALYHLLSFHRNPQNEIAGKKQTLFLSITAAINANATCASLFAAQLFAFTPGASFTEFLVTFATLSIGKNLDFRALEQLLKSMGNNLFINGINFPPVLVRSAQISRILNEHPSKAEHLYDEAIHRYGNQVPNAVLLEAAILKNELGKTSEAGELLYRAIVNAEDYGTEPIKPPTALLVNSASGLITANRLSAADVLLMSALANAKESGETVPISGFYSVSCIKQKLNKLEEADALFTFALANAQVTGEIIPLKYFFYLAKLKAKLGQWEEAKKLIDKYQSTYQETVGELPPDIKEFAEEVQNRIDELKVIRGFAA